MWGEVHSDSWWGYAGGDNSQLALPFTFDPWWLSNYLAYITWFFFYSLLGMPAAAQAALSLIGLLFTGQALTSD